MVARVVLFERATLIVKQALGIFEAVTHFSESGVGGSVEQQLDRAVRRLASKRRDVSLRVEVEAEGERFEADFTICRGRFDNVRRSMTDALVQQAIQQRSRALLEKAQRLDGVEREFCQRWHR
jgi:hypothetical protein